MNALPNSITTAGLYLGSNNLGYHDGSAYKSYMDSSGNFYLGGTSGALQWNGTTLSIEGNITITGGQTADQLNQINAATGSNASAASNAATAASNAAGDAATAQQAADDAQNTADSKTDDTVANAASASAAAAQSTADGINANTGSLINPTSFTFNPNNLTNVSASPAGLHLGANQLGYSDGTSFKSFMDSSGNFYLGGTSGALTWTASTSVLNVNRVTATSGTIGSWGIASTQLEGGTAVSYTHLTLPTILLV